MPEPRPGETQEEFISRCIPVVMDDGTASDNKQAAAVCFSIWERSKENEQADEQETLTIYTEAEITKPPGDVELTGREWLVTIIGPKTPAHLVTIDGEDFIRSENGRLYSVEALRNSATSWDGVKVYDNHLTDEEYFAKNGMRSPKNEWLGTIVKTFWDEATKKIRGIFKVVEKSLAEKLKAAKEMDVLKTIGLSIDTFPISDRELVWEGNPLPVIDGFAKILSVDLVGDPAAGGSLDRLIASTQNSKEKHEMPPNELTEEDVKQLIADGLAGVPGMVATAVKDALQSNVEAEEPEDETPETEVEETPEEETPEEEDETLAEANRILTEARLTQCGIRLDNALGKAKLTPELEAVVRDHFKSRVFETAELDKFIKQLKVAQAAMDPTGRVSESGGNRGDVQVGMDKRAKAEVELLRLLAGNVTFRGLEANQDEMVTQRIPESYKGWVKDGRQHYGTRRLSEWVYELLGGDPFSDPRAYEAVTTSGMTSITKNVLNLLLANDYSVRERWWDPIVTVEEVDTIDQATLVRTYGIDTLDVVEEGQPYTEIEWADDEETADFVKKGNFVAVTLEMLLKDKLNQIRSIPRRLSDSWFNTLSDLNSAVFTVNSNTGPVLSDTGALFNATAVTSAGGHANLLTTVLGTTSAAYAAARLAMMKQTAQALGTGRRLMIIPRFLLVPVDLEMSAKIVMNTIENPGQANYEVNPWANESQVIPVPQWTDATDWALVGDPAIQPAIWNIFLRGQRAPQLFTSDSETAGAMFTNDVMRFKVRMMTWRFSSTYDCAPVSDFRPLHKNNCAG